MIKQLTASVTAQAETLASLSIKTNSKGGGGGGEKPNKKKTRPELNLCAHWKKEVYHRESNWLEMEAD